MTRRRGAAAVETALVLPVLLVLLTGAFESAWFLHQRYVVVDAARTAARAAAEVTDLATVSTTASTAATTVLAAASIDASRATVTVTQDTTSGTVLNVEVRMPYRALMGLTPTPATLHGRATAVWEDPTH